MPPRRARHRPPRPHPDTRARLDALLATHDRAAHVARDPVAFVHRYPDPGDAEIAGLVAALVAFGNVVAVRASVGRALEALGPSPARTVEAASEGALLRRLDGWAHRVYRAPHLARVLHRAGRLRLDQGSVGAALAGHRRDAGDLQESLARLADDLRGPDPERGLAHLVPNPRSGSACKRLLLYLRWMVRPRDGVDLGLWRDGVAPADLVMPLDTHVFRISRNLRLTGRKVPSWAAAEEITAALRRFDPADPVKYDFAICHLGVSRECPSRRDPARCDRCALRSVCRVWSGRRRGPARAAAPGGAP